MARRIAATTTLAGAEAAQTRQSATRTTRSQGPWMSAGIVAPLGTAVRSSPPTVGQTISTSALTCATARRLARASRGRMWRWGFNWRYGLAASPRAWPVAIAQPPIRHRPLLGRPQPQLQWPLRRQAHAAATFAATSATIAARQALSGSRAVNRATPSQPAARRPLSSAHEDRQISTSAARLRAAPPRIIVITIPHLGLRTAPTTTSAGAQAARTHR